MQTVDRGREIMSSPVRKLSPIPQMKDHRRSKKRKLQFDLQQVGALSLFGAKARVAANPT
jgi:hypothetical protein